VTVSVAFDPAAAAPRMPVSVELTVDGERRLLPARLLATTASEIAQLRRGTMFALCLDDALQQSS